ncbi:MAG: hypothetical protein K0S23_630 [Fluviicola sp.]|jgi:hypothetical protein|uniref:hypothetical protein n=1 Tax=Fluviicola sp. TaxID=1917219 RepID=UPI0026021FB8|nr:hypothetical protein [Fluviicola sp.]MDF3026323.1 hypothetical protein [Fluviicola sp.]
MKKPFLYSSKPYTGIIHTILISILGLVVIYLFILNYQLKAQVDAEVTINPSKVQPNISSETSTSVILTFIGIGFALFAFLTFQSLKDFYQNKISEIEKKHEEHEAQYQSQYNSLGILESSLNHTLSIIMNDLARKYLQEGDISAFIMAEMVECEKLVLIIQSKFVASDLFKEQCQEALATNIQWMEFELRNRGIEKFQVNTVAPEVLKARQITILNGVSDKDYQTMNSIFGKIDLQPVPKNQ